MNKKKKYVLPEYGFGGDLLTTAGNLMTDLTGMGGFSDGLGNNIDNEVMRKINRFSNKYIDPVTSSVVPGVMNLAMPGSGAAVSAVNGFGEALFNKPQSTSQPMNIDPRMQQLANGGVIEMPRTTGTDTIPVDQTGTPSAISKKPSVALTDSGEVVWNGYVFSDDLGYASKAKNIVKRYKLRLGEDLSGKDKLSRTQMDRELADLADQQERYKEDSNITDSSTGYATGGTIKIKESNEGKFTEAANRRNMGVQEFASHILSNKDNYSPTMIKRANFARNAAEWKHNEIGGDLLNPDDPNKLYSGSNIFDDLEINDPYANDRKMLTVTPSLKGVTDDSIMNTTYHPSTNISNTLSFGPDEFALAGNLLSLGARGINALTNRQKDFSPINYTPAKMNLERERNDAERQALLSRRMLSNRYRNNRAAQIAGITGVDEQLASAMNKSYLNEGQYNTESINKQRMITAESQMKMRELQEQEKAASAGLIDSMLNDSGSAVSQYYKDKENRKLQKQMLSMMMNSGMYYNPVYDKSGTPIDFKVKSV